MNGSTGRVNAGLGQQLVGRLQDPIQLRLFVLGLALAIGYLGIYVPYDNQIRAASSKLAAERRRLELAGTVEELRAEAGRFRQRFGQNADSNQWVRQVLGGLQGMPVQLVAYSPEPARDLGPFKAPALRLELEGRFADLTRYLHWLEGNERLLRGDSLAIEPSRSGDGLLTMKLTVLGMMELK
jgi:hypothetical protein